MPGAGHATDPHPVPHEQETPHDRYPHPVRIVDVPDFVTMTEPEPGKPMRSWPWPWWPCSPKTTPCRAAPVPAISARARRSACSSAASRTPSTPGPVGSPVRRHRHRLPRRQGHRRQPAVHCEVVRLRGREGGGLAYGAPPAPANTQTQMPGWGIAVPRPGPTSRSLIPLQKQGDSGMSQDTSAPPGTHGREPSSSPPPLMATGSSTTSRSAPTAGRSTSARPRSTPATTSTNSA